MEGQNPRELSERMNRVTLYIIVVLVVIAAIALRLTGTALQLYKWRGGSYWDLGNWPLTIGAIVIFAAIFAYAFYKWGK